MLNGEVILLKIVYYSVGFTEPALKFCLMFLIDAINPNVENRKK